MENSCNVGRDCIRGDPITHFSSPLKTIGRSLLSESEMHYIDLPIEGKPQTMFDRMIQKRNEGGFTLIELLIVIIILAILAAIVVFAVGTTGTNATTAACSADAKTFETALESYKAEVAAYPAEGTGSLPPAGSSGEYGLLGNTTVNGGDWTLNGQTIGPFMRSLPQTSRYQVVTDGNGGVFILPPPADMKLTTVAASLAANGGNPRVEDVSTLAGAATDASFINFDETQPAGDTQPCADTSLVS
jgi:prepilin-type N-terminal cleavage/methylation domain-containing protein